MATSTPNHGLYKYGGDDSPDLTKLGPTMDKIDAQLADYTTFKSKFTGSFASIGWRKLPDGTIEQWGFLLKEGLTPNAWNSFVVSFPIAFTYNVWNVAPVIYPFGGSSDANGVTSYGYGTATQFTAYVKPDSSGKFYYMWRAFGI